MLEQQMEERRRARRRPVVYYLQIMDAKKRQSIGHLVDITSGGLMIDSQTPITVGQEYRLLIHTAADVADTSFIEFTALSKWCRPDSLDPNLYDVGFEIVKVSSHDAKIIEQIVEKYSAQDTPRIKL